MCAVYVMVLQGIVFHVLVLPAALSQQNSVGVNVTKLEFYMILL